MKRKYIIIRFFAILLVVALTIGLCACSQGGVSDTGASSGEPGNAAPVPDQPAPQGTIIPSWYTPQKLTVTTMTFGDIPGLAGTATKSSLINTSATTATSAVAVATSTPVVAATLVGTAPTSLASVATAPATATSAVAVATSADSATTATSAVAVATPVDSTTSSTSATAVATSTSATATHSTPVVAATLVGTAPTSLATADTTSATSAVAVATSTPVVAATPVDSTTSSTSATAADATPVDSTISSTSTTAADSTSTDTATSADPSTDSTTSSDSATSADTTTTTDDTSSATPAAENDNLVLNNPQFGVDYYLNPNTDQIVEPYSMIREKMNLSPDTNIYLMGYGPVYHYGPKNWDYIYYYTYTGEYSAKKNVSAYVMDVNSGAYRALPAQIDWKYSFITVTEDGRYMSVDESQDTSPPVCDKVYLIDLTDMSTKLLTDKSCLCMPEISPTGRYLIYGTADSINALATHPTMGHFYDFTTGETIDSPVEVDDRNLPNGFQANQFFDNDRYYIGISTQDHQTPIVVETATGKQVDDSVAKDNIGRYSVGWNLETVNQGDSNIYRYDFFGGADTPLFDVNSGCCYTYSRDGKYAYTYVPGDDHVKCIDVMTLQSFDAPVSSEFTNQIAQLAAKGIPAIFYNYGFQASSDNTKLSLSFQLDGSAAVPASGTAVSTLMNKDGTGIIHMRMSVLDLVNMFAQMKEEYTNSWLTVTAGGCDFVFIIDESVDPSGNTNMALNSVKFRDSSAQTSDGLKIGDTIGRMKQIYGDQDALYVPQDPSENAVFSYTFGSCQIDISTTATDVNDANTLTDDNIITGISIVSLLPIPPQSWFEP